LRTTEAESQAVAVRQALEGLEANVRP